MTIKEMHIEVGLSSQQVASSINRRFIPEEVDWVLNKVIERYVKDCIKPKALVGESDFEEFQVDVDKINTLMEYDIPLRTRAKGGVYTANLPANYLHLVEDSSFTVNSCKAPLIGILQNKTLYYNKLHVVHSSKTSAPYYANLALSINGVSLIDPGDIPTNLQSKEMLFTMITVVRDLIEQKLDDTIQVYWERSPDMYSPNSLIIVSDSPVTSSLSYDGVTIVGVESTFNIQRPDLKEEAKKNVNRLTKSDRIGKLQQSSFAKSRHNSPLSALDKQTLRVYSDNTFIVTQVLISYVRKPRKVSLILNKNCDLPEDVHQDICDRAVEYLKMTTLDPGYQAKLQDNKLRGN